MKKIPMRMCVACREMRPKKELLRVVRTEDGKAVIDLTGKRNGRGAYLCPSRTCLEKAVKSKALDRALETTLDKETVEQLKKEISDAEQAL